MTPQIGPHRLLDMQLRVWILLIGLAFLLLALGGWAVDGIRWVWRGGRSRRLATA
jgi:hypothetical protein